jgi:hypothetical protein
MSKLTLSCKQVFQVQVFKTLVENMQNEYHLILICYSPITHNANLYSSKFDTYWVLS